MIRKLKVIFILFTILLTYFSVFSTISYASRSNEEVVNIVKNIPLYYAFDIEKFQMENSSDIVEYSNIQLKKYITQLINDDSFKIEIEEVGGGGDFNIYEWDADIKIFKGTTLIDTVKFRYDNNTQLVMMGILTVPYVNVEKDESEKITYAENVLKNRYKIDFQQYDTYDIEKISQNKTIVALDTKNNYSNDELINNFYQIVCHTPDSYTYNNEILIIQKEYTENDYTEYISNLINNMPKHYGFDIEKFNLEDAELLEYTKSTLERELNKYINDDLREINIDIVDYARKSTSMELNLNVKIIKDNILENTISFNSNNNNLINIYSLISVPYGIEDIVEYAQNRINVELDYTEQYELKKYNNNIYSNNSIFYKNPIILLETEKYGTYKVYNGVYEFIPQNDNSKLEYMLIMQNNSFSEGKGTKEEPYLISTPEELNAIRVRSNANYKLTDDIDLTYSTTNEKGIFYNKGKGWKSINEFSGVLDGNNKKIIGLTQNVCNENAGLFRNVTGKIMNLNLENININADYDGTVLGYNNISGLTSSLNGEIDDVVVTGNIMVNAMDNSPYQPLYSVGAIAGWAFYDSNISNVVNKANIQIEGTATSGNYGGILGIGRSTKIINAVNYGNVKSTKSGTFLGGIVGDIDCYNGISEIINCENKGNLESRGTIGGIAGMNSGTTIRYCKNYGNITTDNLLGGITGDNSDYTDKNNITRKGVVEECFNTGSLNINIEGNAIYNRTGGIAGMNSGEICNCFNTGIVNISGYNRDRSEFIQFYIGIGGLVGENGGNIYTSYSTGLGDTNYGENLIEYMNINALVGKVINNSCIIKDCYYFENGLYAYSDMNNEKIKTEGNLTLDEMQLEESYIGFDFNNTWHIEKTTLYKFPKLIKNDIEDKILQKGDINGDGKINGKDWNRLYEHINETNLLTEEELKRADVNGDGKVNGKDWNRLYEHINETNPLF